MQRTERIPLTKIRIDGGTQSRVELCTATLAEYREARDRGEVLPPIGALFDGVDYWLYDGFHRFFEAKDRGDEDIECHVQSGTCREAVLKAAGANARHGKPRTIADKEKVVNLLLNDPEWGKKSIEWIKDQCRVSFHFVDKIIKDRAKDGEERPAMIKGRDGIMRPSRANRSEAGGEEPEKVEEAQSGQAQSTTVKDAKGRSVPERLSKVFETATRFRSLMQSIGRLKTEATELSNLPGAKYLMLAGVCIDLDNAQRAIRFAAPYVVCPECGGLKCSVCNGQGWFKEGDWEHLTKEQRQKCEAA